MNFYVKYPEETLEECILNHGGIPAGADVETAAMWARIYHEDALADGEVPPNWCIVDELGNVHLQPDNYPTEFRGDPSRTEMKRLEPLFAKSSSRVLKLVK